MNNGSNYGKSPIFKGRNTRHDPLKQQTTMAIIQRILIILALLSGIIAFDSEINAQTTSFTTRQAPLPCLDKKFTVVAHVFLDSLTQNPLIGEPAILSVIDGLNELFAPICASFEVCEFNYSPFYSYDTLYSQEWIEEMDRRFSVPNHINIYFIGSDYAEDPELCGRATRDGISMPESSFIMVERNCLTAFSLARHMGTYFGLFPTNHGDNLEELVNGSNCETTGDFICDTPADPFDKAPSGGPYTNGPECLFILEDTDANGEHYQPDLGNIMSPYFWCHCGFSRQQYIRMATNYLESERKKW